MKKYKIIIKNHKRQHRADVLKLKKLWIWTWWEPILTEVGSRWMINYYITQWCKEFGVDEVEDLTK